MRLTFCQMPMVSPGDSGQRFPSLDGNMAIGFRSKTEDDFGSINGCINTRTTLTDAWFGNTVIKVLNPGLTSFS